MHARWLTLVVVTAVALGACSSDKKKSAPAKDAGTDSGSVDSGSGLTADSGSGAITCGVKSCKAPDLAAAGAAAGAGAGAAGGLFSPALIASLGFGPTVCCAGASKDICGVTQSMLIPDGTCIEQGQAGKADKACPNESTMVAGLPVAIPLTGCCKPTNKCGVDLSLLGVGCLERSEASKLMPPTDGGPAPLGAIDCNYTGSTPGNDAGTSTGNDAGSDAGN